MMLAFVGSPGFTLIDALWVKYFLHLRRLGMRVLSARAVSKVNAIVRKIVGFQDVSSSWGLNSFTFGFATRTI